MQLTIKLMMTLTCVNSPTCCQDPNSITGTANTPKTTGWWLGNEAACTRPRYSYISCILDSKAALPVLTCRGKPNRYNHHPTKGIYSPTHRESFSGATNWQHNQQTERGAIHRQSGSVLSLLMHLCKWQPTTSNTSQRYPGQMQHPHTHNPSTSL